jgi:uncharacterized Tic20 family protein
MDTPARTSSGDDRLWGAVAHLSALSMYFTGIGFIAGPLIVWLWKRDTSDFAGQEAREALNFNISIFIYYAVAGVLCLTIILLPLMIAVIGIIHVFHIICIIVGGVKAGDGLHFRYPLNLRLVK